MRKVFPVLALLLLAASAGRAAEPSDIQTIEVDLSNFRFSPERLVMQRGQSYRLHLVNKASGGHDFVAEAFFASVRVAATDRNKLRGGKISIGGGEAADVQFVTGGPGTYEFHCSHFMHSAFGMKGSIVIQ